MAKTTTRTHVRLAVGTAGVLVAAAFAGGCGGKASDSGAGAQDAGVPDISTDTFVGDQGDEVPSSLFDAPIPDVVFGGGKTLAGCVDCVKLKCNAELKACDADARCRGLALCALIDCKASTTDTLCLLGCATKFNVTLDDPVLVKALAIGKCSDSKCKASCPSVVDSGPSDTGTKPDGAMYYTPPEWDPPQWGPPQSGLPERRSPSASTVDPAVLDALRTFCSAFDGAPELARGVVDTLSHD